MIKVLSIAGALLSCGALLAIATPTTSHAEANRLSAPRSLETPADDATAEPAKTEEKRESAELAAKKRDVRAAWAEVTSVNEAITKVKQAMAPLLRVTDRKTPEGRAEFTRLYMLQRDMLEPLNQEHDKRVDAFVEVFATSELDKWNAKNDHDLLEEGLFQLAYLKGKDNPAEAVKLYEMLLKEVNDSKYAGSVYNYYLPATLLSIDDYESVKKKLTALAQDCTEDKIYAFAVFMGELEAIHGNTDAAVKIWKDALATIPAELEPRDPRMRDKGYLEVRANNVGAMAKEIDSKTWLGADAKALSAMKGQIVVVDFWATWCSPCIASMPGMDDLRKEYKDKGVEVLGVTRFYGNGYLATDMQELRDGKRDGEYVKDMDEKTFMKHLAQFRENTQCSYPFVVADADEVAAYGITGIPTMAILDRSGKVVFVTVGGGKEAVVKLVIEKLLAKDKAAEKAPEGTEK